MYPYQHTISRPYGQLDPIIHWCESYVDGDWAWCLLDHADPLLWSYTFFFADSKSFSAFILRWTK